MPRPRVAIVDYGAGNLHSVEGACRRLGGEVVRVTEARDIAGASHVVLPGVGSMFSAMRVLNQTGLAQAIASRARAENGHLLGICLGMQLLATMGAEGGHVEGLDLVPGKVRHLEALGKNQKVPRIGWFDVTAQDEGAHGLLPSGTYYFAHSYVVCGTRRRDQIATTLCEDFSVAAAVRTNNIIGVQFHPEKSGEVGLEFLNQFLKASD